MLRHSFPRVFALSIAALLSYGAIFVASAQPQKTAPDQNLNAALEKARSQASKNLDVSVFDSIGLQLEIADRIGKDYPTQATAFRARAASWLKTANEGRDPLQAAQGQIVMRGYSSAVSRVRQGYAIYLPRNYDPTRAYPLMLVLHGGSANGNLFLGVVLGNNMNWKEYDRHLWDEFTPRYQPDWIVVAPNGFGQVMWRFMGEQDVLDVLADVQRHYHVDSERVVLTGLSNGGVGAYSLGMRHASRFAAVLAIAGAPSWLQYTGGKIDPLQAEELRPLSALDLAENAINTDFRYFHGRVDPGPMRPAFVEAFSKHIATLGVPYTEKWFDTGHDLLYLVVRQGALFKDLQTVTRKQKPSEVRLVTGDYRAAQQHWLRVTSITRLPELARVRAVAKDNEIRIEVNGADALDVTWKDAPLSAADELHWIVNGVSVAKSSRKGLPEVVTLTRSGDKWRLGSPQQQSALSKQPGSAGPITDAYFGKLLHVYGTRNPAHSDELRKQAERGARGWPLWLWRVDQPVLADTDVTDEMLRENNLVLYATPGSHALLSRIEAQLPIRVESDAVVVGTTRYTDKGVGTKFIYPNPLNPKRYVIVQAAPTVEAVRAGYNLPDFLPDYVVYDAKTTRARPRLLFPAPPPALGFFNQAWQLDETHTQRAMLQKPKDPNATRHIAQREGNDPESADVDNPPSPLPVPVAPEAPAAPQAFATEPTTQAGKAAREIARRVGTFTNYRKLIAGATWRVDQSSVWSIREADSCLSDLTEHGIEVQPWKGQLATPVATPVQLHAAVGGVTFRFLHAAAGAVISCELAARLRDIADILARHGVHTVHVMSAYRDHPYPSFHTLGLALDLSRFDTEAGPLIVKSDFSIDRARETCDEPTGKVSDKHKRLQAIACDLAASRRFSSVLTPNYNVGHRDHFHIDVRPNDPRLFVR
ncbi:MAG TPA: extensin family protein [Polyangiales bacterium]|nr:extensin family protein [Polyangiales bacterium]